MDDAETQAILPPPPSSKEVAAPYQRTRSEEELLRAPTLQFGEASSPESHPREIPTYQVPWQAGQTLEKVEELPTMASEAVDVVMEAVDAAAPQEEEPKNAPAPKVEEPEVEILAQSMGSVVEVPPSRREETEEVPFEDLKPVVEVPASEMEEVVEEIPTPFIEESTVAEVKVSESEESKDVVVEVRASDIDGSKDVAVEVRASEIEESKKAELEVLASQAETNNEPEIEIPPSQPRPEDSPPYPVITRHEQQAFKNEQCPPKPKGKAKAKASQEAPEAPAPKPKPKKAKTSKQEPPADPVPEPKAAGKPKAKAKGTKRNVEATDGGEVTPRDLNPEFESAVNGEGEPQAAKRSRRKVKQEAPAPPTEVGENDAPVRAEPVESKTFAGRYRPSRNEDAKNRFDAMKCAYMDLISAKVLQSAGTMQAGCMV